MRPRALLAAAFVTVGIVVTVTATPASAATAPTIAVSPTVSTGYSQVTITGTADADATVTLYESAYIWNDLILATDWATGAPVTAKASSSGAYSIKRYVDSGFIFQVEAGGARSAAVTVRMTAVPALTVTSTTTGTVSVRVTASPDQPWLPVEIHRQDSGGWTRVAGGSTGAAGTFDATLTGQGSGPRTYRATVGPDTENGILAGQATGTVTVAGTAPSPPVGTAPSPPAGTAPSTPAVGSVQFTKIQYHGPSGLTNEWFRLTNKTGAAISLSGWTVRDAAGNTYSFNASYSLGAGRTVSVHTGAGKATASDRYWGRRVYIWNNGGDTATLRAGTKTIDTCRWTADKQVTYC